MPEWCHITFATAEFSQAAHLLAKSARRFGLTTEVYSRSSPVVAALAGQHPDIMGRRRGAGYWLWKPAIILDALSRCVDGDLILYTDADLTIIQDPEPLFALTNRNPIVLFEHLPRGVFPNGDWTKRDCFVLLDADEPLFWTIPNLMGHIHLYRASDEARRFAQEFLDAASDPRVLTDDPNVMGKPNLPGFSEHRHEQSVMTVIAQKWSLPVFPDPSQMRWGDAVNARVKDGGKAPDDGVERPPVTYDDPIIYNHHKRNRAWPIYIGKRLLREYTGGRFFL